MTIDSSYAIEQYKADEDVEYIFGHESIGTTAIEVFKVLDTVRTLLILDVDYTLEFGYRDPIFSRGKVILTKPLSAGEILSIERYTPRTQDFSVVPQKDFPSGEMEFGLDKITFMLQELEGHLCDCRDEGAGLPFSPTAYLDFLGELEQEVFDEQGGVGQSNIMAMWIMDDGSDNAFNPTPYGSLHDYSLSGFYPLQYTAAGNEGFSDFDLPSMIDDDRASWGKLQLANGVDFRDSSGLNGGFTNTTSWTFSVLVKDLFVDGVNDIILMETSWASAQYQVLFRIHPDGSAETTVETATGPTRVYRSEPGFVGSSTAQQVIFHFDAKDGLAPYETSVTLDGGSTVSGGTDFEGENDTEHVWDPPAGQNDFLFCRIGANELGQFQYGWALAGNLTIPQVVRTFEAWQQNIDD